MTSISESQLNAIKKNHGLDYLTETDFDPDLFCLSFTSDNEAIHYVARLYILDNKGRWLWSVTENETVREALDYMGELIKKAVYVLDYEINEVAVIPQHI